jgi:glutamyl-Q tRNA(Asp) synthetase
MAQSAGGRFLLRIEDIDTTRTRLEFITAIFDDLAWLGLTWEQPVLFQSERFAAYAEAASRLRKTGLLYPCFASRSEINAVVANCPNLRDPDGAPLFPVTLRRVSEAVAADRQARGETFALRLDMARAVAAVEQKLKGQPLTFREIGPDGQIRVVPAEPQRWGDVVIMRKETPASYHIAVVVDDAFQGVTHVTRGQDLFAATGLHRLLQVLLDLPEPIYHHHGLVRDEAGLKLSKSAGSVGLSSLRASGLSPEALIAQLDITAPTPLRP